MNNKSKRVIIVILSILFQFSFALAFTSSPNLLIDNLLNRYTVAANSSQWSNNYVHTEIMLNDNYISDDSADFVRNNISRREETVTYYSLSSENHENPTLTTTNYLSTPKILYNPYRYDFNSEYAESFKIRQEFVGVDSRKIDAGFDFNIQISTEDADKILSANGINDGYDYFRNNKIEVSLYFNENEYKGLITNLFHIEKEEPISKELLDYNGNYSLIVPAKQLSEETSFRLNHDFINNSSRIKKEMIKLNASFDEESINFFDGSNNSDLIELYQTLTHKATLNLGILLPSLSGIVLSAIGLFFLIRSIKPRKEYVNQSLPIDCLLSVFLFSTIIYILKRLFATGFFYMLGNLFSGLLTVFLFIYMIVKLYKRERKATKNEE